MLNYTLPVSVWVNGNEYAIRSDFRAILDICCAIEDTELSDSEKALTALIIFYPEFEKMNPRDYDEALKEMFKFISLGEEPQAKKKEPKLVDWEQDFNHIIAPVNKVAGKEIRALEYLHWWTFISYYNEIDGDCFFAQIVQIRSKKAHGKKLDEQDRTFYNKNHDVIDFKQKFTSAEEALLDEWIK